MLLVEWHLIQPLSIRVFESRNTLAQTKPLTSEVSEFSEAERVLIDHYGCMMWEKEIRRKLNVQNQELRSSNHEDRILYRYLILRVDEASLSLESRSNNLVA